MARLEKIKHLYQTIALLAFNTCLCFGVFNIFLALVGQAAPPRIPETERLTVYTTDIIPTANGFDILRTVYPGYSDGGIIQLLLETRNVPRRCDERLGFIEDTFEGHFIRVDPAGFRWGKAQGPWEPMDEAFNIFVFGGSTTFGYGEIPESTIPSLLQEYLKGVLPDKPVYVYNFGHGNYFSYQERLHFEQLIEDGFVPDMAIFIDGLNDAISYDGKPVQVDCQNAPSERLFNTFTCRPDELCTPFQRWVANAQPSTSNPTADINQITDPNAPPPDDAETNLAIIQRWLENKKRIEATAAREGIPVYFVLQPVPGYAYDVRYFSFAPSVEAMGNFMLRVSNVYGEWEALAQSNPEWTGNFINLARLGEDNQEAIYVDNVHYTGKFMWEIAQAIGQVITPQIES